MEALAIQELDSSSSIAWYFWHNNYQSATRSMNERENRSVGIDHALPWLRTARHASSRVVSPTNWEFHVSLYEKVNNNKWRPVQVPLAWSVYVVVST